MSAEWVNFHEAKFRKASFTTNAYYKACPTTDCNKKVVDQDNGIYRCDKRNIEGREFKYRLLINVCRNFLLLSLFIYLFTALNHIQLWTNASLF
jgi:Replication factor-A C terminal domain